MEGNGHSTQCCILVYPINVSSSTSNNTWYSERNLFDHFSRVKHMPTSLLDIERAWKKTLIKLQYVEPNPGER